MPRPAVFRDAQYGVGRPSHTNATQQAFLKGNEHGFAYFGGVFRTLRYDNLSSVVNKILRERQREETNRVIASVRIGDFKASTAIRRLGARKVVWKARWVGIPGREPDAITTVFNGQTSVCPKLDNHATTSPNTQVVVVGPNRYACPAIQ